MLMAKLLGGLASALAVLALVAAVRTISPIDVYFHDVYFVVGPSGFSLLDALLCGTLAVIYFAISRWKLQPPNQLVGLAGFTLIVISLITFFAASILFREDSLPHDSHLYALFGALYGFLFGLVLLAANIAWAFAWTMLSKVRSHLSSR
jgi:hypothetical protein